MQLIPVKKQKEYLIQITQNENLYTMYIDKTRLHGYGKLINEIAKKENVTDIYIDINGEGLAIYGMLLDNSTYRIKPLNVSNLYEYD